MKRILAISLMLVLLLGLTTTFAAEEPTNLLTGNADFEKGKDSSFEGWNKSLIGNWETKIYPLHARSGNKSLELTISKENATESDVTLGYTGGVEKLVPGTEYVMSAWIRTEKTLEHVSRAERLGLQLYARVNGAGGVQYNISSQQVHTSGKWHKVEQPFVLSAEEDTVQFFIRLLEGTYGTIYVDDVRVDRKADIDPKEKKIEEDRGELEIQEEPPVPDPTVVPMPEGKENLFTNGSFEEVDAGGAPVGGWASYGGAWNDMVQIVDGGYDGKKCVRLKTDNDKAHPWVFKEDMTVKAGMEYQVSVWLKTVTESASGPRPRLKIEFYDKDGTNFFSSQSENFPMTYGVWHQKSCRFTAPMGAVRAKIYLRMYYAGEICYDDAQCYEIGEASRLLYEGDTFFYTEWKEGTFGVSVNTGVYEPTGREVVDIRLKDGETVLASRLGASPMPEAMFRFDIASLAEIGKEYTAEATLYSAPGGEVIEVTSWPVYRFNRPKMITEDGNFIVNGEQFNPVWGYHVYASDDKMKLAKAAGINVIQGGGASLESAKAYLDLAQENGLMATLLLYSGMKSAGTEGKVENTIEMVTELKDHPALFGYLIMDEPFLHMSDPYPDLQNAYKIIRQIDDVHPVIIQELESTGSTKYTAATSDLLLIHHYACKADLMADARWGMEGSALVIRRMMDDLSETHVNRKVVHFLGQSFGNSDKDTAQSSGSGYYLPTIDEAKSHIYQAFIEGMDGIGYYSLEEANWHVKDTPLYEPLCDFAKEYDLLYDAFVYDKGTLFNKELAGNVWWYTFSMDGALYVIAMNVDEAAHEVQIPLTSINGKIKVGAFTATLISGTNQKASLSGENTLSLSLAEHETAFYKITPSENVDFSVMEGNFDDMENHTWAKESVDALHKKGISNTKGIRTFAPAENITRADFAMFLIRTLGIQSDADEVFADVDPNAEYAKEIAIGKAAGILKGVGDDAYNPEAAITRQDMMVIVQRGLEYAHRQYEKGAGNELDAFSDKDMVADYAQEALSAMVKSGIIQGNADGTVNPRGNATRAEAAVVMHRIM